MKVDDSDTPVARPARQIVDGYSSWAPLVIPYVLNMLSEL